MFTEGDSMTDEDFGDVSSFPPPKRLTLGEVTPEQFKKYEIRICREVEDYLAETLSVSEAAEALGLDDSDDLDGTVFGDLADELCYDYESFKEYIAEAEIEDIEIPR